MKRWILFGSLVAVVAGAVISYLTVPPVRRFVDRIPSALGFSRSPEGVTYWCPMDPEIVRENPGTCPV